MWAALAPSKLAAAGYASQQEVSACVVDMVKTRVSLIIRGDNIVPDLVSLAKTVPDVAADPLKADMRALEQYLVVFEKRALTFDELETSKTAYISKETNHIIKHLASWPAGEKLFSDGALIAEAHAVAHEQAKVARHACHEYSKALDETSIEGEISELTLDDLEKFWQLVAVQAPQATTLRSMTDAITAMGDIGHLYINAPGRTTATLQNFVSHCGDTACVLAQHAFTTFTSWLTSPSIDASSPPWATQQFQHEVQVSADWHATFFEIPNIPEVGFLQDHSETVPQFRAQRAAQTEGVEAVKMLLSSEPTLAVAKVVLSYIKYTLHVRVHSDEMLSFWDGHAVKSTAETSLEAFTRAPRYIQLKDVQRRAMSSAIADLDRLLSEVCRSDWGEHPGLLLRTGAFDAELTSRAQAAITDALELCKTADAGLAVQIGTVVKVLRAWEVSMPLIFAATGAFDLTSENAKKVSAAIQVFKDLIAFTQYVFRQYRDAHGIQFDETSYTQDGFHDNFMKALQLCSLDHADVLDKYPISYLIQSTLKWMGKLIDDLCEQWATAVQVVQRKIEAASPEWRSAADQLMDEPPPEQTRALLTNPSYKELAGLVAEMEVRLAIARQASPP
ncbi:unnamed protein product, partial [Prorocentrum cordatum]